MNETNLSGSGLLLSLLLILSAALLAGFAVSLTSGEEEPIGNNSICISYENQEEITYIYGAETMVLVNGSKIPLKELKEKCLLT